MPGTAEHRGQLIAAYWANGAVLRCPSCQEALDVSFRSTASYTIDVRRPAGCDETTLGPDDDPLRGDFRPWTADEQGQIILHDHLTGQAPRCPVCGTAMFVSSAPTRGGKLVTAQCGRCGNRTEKQLGRAGR